MGTFTHGVLTARRWQILRERPRGGIKNWRVAKRAAGLLRTLPKRKRAMNNSPRGNLRFNQAVVAAACIRVHAHTVARNAGWSATRVSPRLISLERDTAVSFSMETKAHCITEERRAGNREVGRGNSAPVKSTRKPSSPIVNAKVAIAVSSDGDTPSPFCSRVSATSAV